MAAEIQEQPAVLSRILEQQSRSIGRVAAAIVESDPRFVVLAARGTSDHAALYAKYVVEIQRHLPAGLLSPSSITLYRSNLRLDNVLFVAISQSGQSPDLIESTRSARAGGALTIAVTNNPDSPLAAQARHSVDIAAGPERAVAATKSYTAQLLALYLLLAPSSGTDSPHRRAAELASAVDRTLAASHEVRRTAERLRFAEHVLITGRGFGYPTAREGALKITETCRVHAEGLSSADLMHGPIAAVNRNTAAIVVTTPALADNTMRDPLAALRTRGADITVVGDATLRQAGEGYLAADLAGVSYDLAPIVQIVPLQQLAHRLAIARGNNPDSPKGLTKSTHTL